METVCYVQVAVKAAIYSIDKPYIYRLPPELEPTARVGMRVLVPFSMGNRLTEGILLNRWIGEHAPNIKAVRSVLDERPVLDEKRLKLALWMRERYFCTVYDAVRAMLPAGLYYAARDVFTLAEGVTQAEALARVRKGTLQERVLRELERHEGKATREQIYEACAGSAMSGVLHALVDKKLLQEDTSVSRGVSDKTEQIVFLDYPVEDALTKVKKTAKAQREVLKLLGEVGSASLKEISYFTGASARTVKALEKQELVTLYTREVYRRTPSVLQPTQPPPVLNEEQSRVYDALCQLLEQEKAACSLLYGVTGSGKTQIYIRLIHQALQMGRTALVLVPEIALTPQMLQHFEAQFGEKVAILHSSLSAGARYDEWKRIRDGKATVVVGTRSAVFAPLDNIGVIVLDEEQETSYQSEQNPRYHARDIAKYRSAQSGAVLVLGSATPSVESRYLAQRGSYHLLQLKHRFNEQAMPRVEIVDMREELRAGNSTSLSAPLRRELQANLRRGEQSILFLNRRGSSRMVVCGECGEAPECPNCSVKLTYHKDNHRMMCHYCGYSQPMLDKCPACGGDLVLVDAGVQQVEEQLKDAFPKVRIARMDADTVSANNRHEDILKRFEKEQIPILLGTQMVAKGLDFENVTLVGALDADQGLYVDSFHAGERTFSLLTQVVGRAGRGSSAGRAVIQTFTPENEIITCAARQDYDAFYEGEILLRMARGTPPVRDLYLLTLSGTQERHVLESAHRLRSALESWQHSAEMQANPFDIYGPAEAPILRVMGRYRYRLTLLCNDHKRIRSMLSFLLCAFRKDTFNQGVSITVDKNPVD